MLWLIIVIIIILFVVLIFLARQHLSIPRDPAKEGPADAAAIRDYNCIGNWFIFKLERAIILKAMAKYALRGTLLDIGCGPGYLTARISRKYPALRVTGLDISEATVAVARQNWPLQSYPNLKFMTGSAEELPFPDSSVDCVTSSLSLHHFTDVAGALRETYRVLMPGGRLIIFDLRRDCPRYFYYALKIGQALFAPSSIKHTNGAIGSVWASYTAKEFHSLLSAASFHEIEIKSDYGWMLAQGQKPPL